MFIFLLQKLETGVSSQNQQNSAYKQISLDFSQIRQDVIKVAKTRGFNEKEANAHADFICSLASSAMASSLERFKAMPGKPMDENAIIIKFTDDFVKPVLFNENIINKFRKGEITDMFSFISASVSASISADKELKDPGKVSATLQKYGLNDSALRSFLQQLPAALSASSSNGMPRSIEYNIASQRLTENRIAFMQETENFTKEVLEKERKKQA